jgi:hypothetical protein
MEIEVGLANKNMQEFMPGFCELNSDHVCFITICDFVAYMVYCRQTAWSLSTVLSTLVTIFPPHRDNVRVGVQHVSKGHAVIT